MRAVMAGNMLNQKALELLQTLAQPAKPGSPVPAVIIVIEQFTLQLPAFPAPVAAQPAE